MWAILGLFATSSPKKNSPKYMLIGLFFSKGKGERGKREGKVK
jgi:hypothetical protein